MITGASPARRQHPDEFRTLLSGLKNGASAVARYAEYRRSTSLPSRFFNPLTAPLQAVSRRLQVERNHAEIIILDIDNDQCIFRMFGPWGFVCRKGRQVT